MTAVNNPHGLLWPPSTAHAILTLQEGASGIDMETSSWLLWRSWKKGRWLSSSQEAGGEVDGQSWKSWQPGPSPGVQQEGWCQGKGKVVWNLRERGLWLEFPLVIFWNVNFFLLVLFNWLCYVIQPKAVTKVNKPKCCSRDVCKLFW